MKKDRIIVFRTTEDVVAMLDQVADKNERTRSRQIVAYIKAGLAAEKREQT